jgi:hypothetical protein
MAVTSSSSGASSSSSSRIVTLTPGHPASLKGIDAKWQRFTDQTLHFSIDVPRYAATDGCGVHIPVRVTRYGERIAVYQAFTYGEGCQKALPLADEVMAKPQPVAKPDIGSAVTTYDYWAAVAKNRTELDAFVRRSTGGQCRIAEEGETSGGVRRYQLEIAPGANAEDVFACAMYLAVQERTHSAVLARDPKLGGGWMFQFSDGEGANPIGPTFF